MRPSASMVSLPIASSSQTPILPSQQNLTAQTLCAALRIRIERSAAPQLELISPTSSGVQSLIMATTVTSLKPSIYYSLTPKLNLVSRSPTSNNQGHVQRSSNYLKISASVTKLVNLTPCTTRPKRSTSQVMIELVPVLS